jgi:hypothetical protein
LYKKAGGDAGSFATLLEEVAGIDLDFETALGEVAGSGIAWTTTTAADAAATNKKRSDCFMFDI